MLVSPKAACGVMSRFPKPASTHINGFFRGVGKLRNLLKIVDIKGNPYICGFWKMFITAHLRQSDCRNQLKLRLSNNNIWENWHNCEAFSLKHFNNPKQSYIH
jgi:hypothetical protein